MRSPSRGWLWSSALIWPRSSTRNAGNRFQRVFRKKYNKLVFWGIDRCLGCKIQNNSPPSPRPPHCLPVSSASKCRPTLASPSSPWQPDQLRSSIHRDDHCLCYVASLPRRIRAPAKALASNPDFLLLFLRHVMLAGRPPTGRGYNSPQ
jgi:hypothetical protein